MNKYLTFTLGKPKFPADLFRRVERLYRPDDMGPMTWERSMIGNFLITFSIILPMISSVFAQDYRPLRSEADFLYNLQYAYVEIEPDSQKRFKCQMLRQAGQFPKECRHIRVDYKWIFVASGLMILGGIYFRRRAKF